MIKNMTKEQKFDKKGDCVRTKKQFFLSNANKRTPTRPKKSNSPLKSEITFLREELKEKDYVVRTLLNKKSKSIDECNLRHAEIS